MERVEKSDLPEAEKRSKKVGFYIEASAGVRLPIPVFQFNGEGALIVVVDRTTGKKEELGFIGANLSAGLGKPITGGIGVFGTNSEIEDLLGFSAGHTNALRHVR